MRLRHAIICFDSSKGCEGASICQGRNADGSILRSTQRRLCEYAMQAIVFKISIEKNSAMRPLQEIHESVDRFLSTSASFRSRVSNEVSHLSSEEHKSCTPLPSKLPNRIDLGTDLLKQWLTKNAETFKRQARVSGLVKGGCMDGDSGDRGTSISRNDTHKRSRDEFEV